MVCAFVFDSASSSPFVCPHVTVSVTRRYARLGIIAAFLVCAPPCVLGAARARVRGHTAGHLSNDWSVMCLCVCLWAEEDVTWTAAAPEAKYTDIILYSSGSLALAVLLLLAGLYRGQVLHGRQPRQPAAVQKLSRFPLARQVPCHPRPRVL